MNIVNYVIKFENRGKYKNLPMTPKEAPLNENEQQISRYLSGCIVFALKKKYFTFIKCQISKVHNFLEFTHRWWNRLMKEDLQR